MQPKLACRKSAEAEQQRRDARFAVAMEQARGHAEEAAKKRREYEAQRAAEEAAAQRAALAEEAARQQQQHQEDEQRQAEAEARAQAERAAAEEAAAKQAAAAAAGASKAGQEQPAKVRRSWARVGCRPSHSACCRLEWPPLAGITAPIPLRCVCSLQLTGRCARAGC